jgi:hypothetical protein
MVHKIFSKYHSPGMCLEYYYYLCRTFYSLGGLKAERGRHGFPRISETRHEIRPWPYFGLCLPSPSPGRPWRSVLFGSSLPACVQRSHLFYNTRIHFYIKYGRPSSNSMYNRNLHLGISATVSQNLHRCCLLPS